LLASIDVGLVADAISESAMLAQPLVAVANVEDTSAWYQRTLGLASGHGGPEYEQLMFDGRMVLQLHRWDAHEHPYLGDPGFKPCGNGVVLWFLSQEVEDSYRVAVSAGAEILEPIKVNPNANHLEFWLRDPNGYVVVVAGPHGVLGRYAPT
jgi:catechol 2,3-dioxygenase-like lactoylglutathione lyase family enzyme